MTIKHYVRCNNCEKVFLERDIVYEEDTYTELCPYCGEIGYLMDDIEKVHSIDDVVRNLNNGLDRTKEELELCKKWLLEYQVANDMSLYELDDMCYEDSDWVFEQIFG